jgi:hypothetical protein
VGESVLLADNAHRPGRQRFVDDVRGIVPVIDYDAAVAASHAELLVAVRRQGRQVRVVFLCYEPVVPFALPSRRRWRRRRTALMR